MSIRESNEGPETDYEKKQRFSRLVSWLHSFRYSHVLSLLDSGKVQMRDDTVKIVEIGCAHSKLYSLLNDRYDIDYTGIEINQDSVSVSLARYGKNDNYHLFHGSVINAFDAFNGADIIFALETLEHIPEHDVVRIIEAVAAARPRLFVCSVPVEIGPALWIKNVGSFLTGYMRHKTYTWSETFWAGLYQLDRLPPHKTSHRGFDWRWLAQTIRHNLRIMEIRRLPFEFLPAPLAFTVFFIAEPR